MATRRRRFRMRNGDFVQFTYEGSESGVANRAGVVQRVWRARKPSNPANKNRICVNILDTTVGQSRTFTYAKMYEITVTPSTAV